MLNINYKGVGINLKKFSIEAINSASMEWANEYNAKLASEETDADKAMFAELENTDEDYFAGQAPDNAQSFIESFLEKNCPAIYWSLYPIKPDPMQFPDNPEWPLMHFYIMNYE